MFINEQCIDAQAPTIANDEFWLAMAHHEIQHNKGEKEEEWKEQRVTLDKMYCGM